MEELLKESSEMTFYGYYKNKRLVGVMGFQPMKDVTLIRHAYILPEFQRMCIGTKLLNFLKKKTKTKKLLVGTWADAVWAIRFYEKHGFKLVSLEEKNQFLRKYWSIPERQIVASVVLADKKWFDNHKEK